MSQPGFRDKTILLTGATGFIGRHLARRLATCDAKHIVFLTRSRADVGLKANASVSWIECPLEHMTPCLWSKHKVDRIDLVLHLGGFTPKSTAEASNIDGVYRGNVLGTRALLESLPAVPERVVFASSVDVYKQPFSHSIDESWSLDPAGLHGASKAFCEKLTETYCRLNNCAYSILRYGHIYGPGEEAYAKLIPQTIRSLLAGRSPTVHGDGSALRDLLYVSDAVEATLRAAAAEPLALGPINVVSGVSHSIRTVVELIVQATGSSLGINYLQDMPSGSSLRFDNGNMLGSLGTWPLVPLEVGLKKEVAYFRSLQ